MPFTYCSIWKFPYVFYSIITQKLFVSNHFFCSLFYYSIVLYISQNNVNNSHSIDFPLAFLLFEYLLLILASIIKLQFLNINNIQKHENQFSPFRVQANTDADICWKEISISSFRTKRYKIKKKYFSSFTADFSSMYYFTSINFWKFSLSLKRKISFYIIQQIYW